MKKATIVNPHTHEVAVDTEIAAAHGAVTEAAFKVMTRRDRIENTIVQPVRNNRLNGEYFTDADGVDEYIETWVLGHSEVTDRYGCVTGNRFGFEKLNTVAFIEHATNFANAKEGARLATCGMSYEEKKQTAGIIQLLTNGRIALEVVEMIENLQAAWDVLVKARERLAEANKKYEGWARFFLVANNGGHIHKDMECSTCNKMGKETNFIWLPELAALTEVEAVEAHGAILCTVCYPSAPVEWTNGAKPGDELVCPGSGTSPAYRDIDWRYREAKCTHCGKVTPLNRDGDGPFRKHKKEVA